MIFLNLFKDELKPFLDGDRQIEKPWIERWKEECPKRPMNLETKKGAVCLFLQGLLYNYGGGGPNRFTEFKKLYPIIYAENFFESQEYKGLNAVTKAQIKVVYDFVEKIDTGLSDNVLKTWWHLQKEEYKDIERAAICTLIELQRIKYKIYRKGKEVLYPAYTSKAFWIARELHSAKVWEDFPLKFCYVPDVKMIRRKIEEKFGSKYFDLFLISEFLHNELSNAKMITYDWPLVTEKVKKVRVLHR